MSEYQWAVSNGDIVEADYDSQIDSLNFEQVKAELESAFSQYDNSIKCNEASDELKEVFLISFNDRNEKPIYVCAKGTTPGGRKNLSNEQRIQQKSKYLNYTYQKLQDGERAVQFGIYKRENQTIFCAWKLKASSASSETPVSKQIKISTIAKAMKDGFTQQEKSSDEYVCAFRREFIYFYISNSDWLHESTINKLSDNVPPLPMGTTGYDPDEQKARFKNWLKSQKKPNGDSYKDNTINSYISNMNRGYTEFEKYNNYCSVFQIQNIEDLKEYTEYLYNEPNFEEFNIRAGNQACRGGFLKYEEFLIENGESQDINFHTGLESKFSRNRIIFGAPGTGKSFTLNKERIELLGDNSDDYERVTFHPDYSYSNFVGTYKPVPCKDAEGRESITYEYVQGPFMRVFVNAIQNGKTNSIKPFLLIVEEINRSNVAAVFGDIFQLLDRDDEEVSEYSIQASEDIKKYLARELGGNPQNYNKIKIPDNMFIWATMNSADQGVFPMDTAFKRRWDFTYLSINTNETGISGLIVSLGKGKYKQNLEWNKLRRAINDKLSKLKINEDKLLGPYFISKKSISVNKEINSEKFNTTFKNKVLMYLFEDAAKQKKSSLFAEGIDVTKYSSICEEFDEKGVFVFCTEISNLFAEATIMVDHEDESE